MIKARTKNLGIIEAIKELKTMSLSDRLYYMHEQRLKEKRDREWIEEDMYEQGVAKGREDGIKEGLEKGREDGIKFGCENEREKNISAFIDAFLRNGHTEEQIVEELIIGYELSREEAKKKIEMRQL